MDDLSVKLHNALIDFAKSVIDSGYLDMGHLENKGSEVRELIQKGMLKNAGSNVIVLSAKGKHYIKKKVFDRAKKIEEPASIDYEHWYGDLYDLVFRMYFDAYMLQTIGEAKITSQLAQFYCIWGLISEMLKCDLALSLWKIAIDGNPESNTFQHLYKQLSGNKFDNSKLIWPNSLKDNLIKIRNKSLAHTAYIRSGVSIEICDLLSVLNQLKNCLNELKDLENTQRKKLNLPAIEDIKLMQVKDNVHVMVSYLLDLSKKYEYSSPKYLITSTLSGICQKMLSSERIEGIEENENVQS